MYEVNIDIETAPLAWAVIHFLRWSQDNLGDRLLIRAADVGQEPELDHDPLVLGRPLDPFTDDAVIAVPYADLERRCRERVAFHCSAHAGGTFFVEDKADADILCARWKDQTGLRFVGIVERTPPMSGP